MDKANFSDYREMIGGVAAIPRFADYIVVLSAGAQSGKYEIDSFNGRLS